MTDLARRTHQTILLLNTLLDAYPAPTTWTGQLVARATLPGPSPSRWQPCETCDGTGRTLDRFKRASLCAQCQGHGRYMIDDYTGDRINTIQTGLIPHTTTVKCDRCAGDGVWKFKRCELCDGTGRRTVTPRALGATHELTRQRNGTTDLWGKTGSYHELDRSLHELHTINPHAHHQVWHVHVQQDLPPDEAKQPLLSLSVTFITLRMPTPILVPAGVNAAAKRAEQHRLKVRGRHTDPRARAARDTEIRKLHRHGKPVQWIAQQTGLSISSVYDILQQRMKETAA